MKNSVAHTSSIKKTVWVPSHNALISCYSLFPPIYSGGFLIKGEKETHHFGLSSLFDSIAIKVKQKQSQHDIQFWIFNCAKYTSKSTDICVYMLAPDEQYLFFQLAEDYGYKIERKMI